MNDPLSLLFQLTHLDLFFHPKIHGNDYEISKPSKVESRDTHIRKIAENSRIH